MEDIVIVSAARTAVGKFGGSLAKVAAPDLGATVIREAIARARLDPAHIGEVIMGQVLAAGSGQNPARQALMKAGLPQEVPGLTLNAVCGSGLKAVMLAAQAIAYGDSEIVVAGGQENMSASPHVLMGSRDGQRMGDWKMVDSMIVDGLWTSTTSTTWASPPRTWPRPMASPVTCKTPWPWPASTRRPRRRTRVSSRTRSWA
jgi:acetyl-CoA C-acetyltransferase